MFLLKFFGSKKLLAAVVGVGAILLTPILNSKFNLGLSETVVAEVLGAIGMMVLTYIGAQWHIDVKTNGSTTSSALFKSISEAESKDPVLPDQAQAAVRMLLALVKDGPLAEALRSGLPKDGAK